MITVINESYTSKARSIDTDEFNRNEYSTERICRGLFKRKNGMILNADSNAAFHIIRNVKSISIDICIITK